MEHDLAKCVILVDFTKWGLVVDGNVHCFVVCVLFGEEQIVKRGNVVLYLALLSITYNAEKWEIEDWKPTIKYYDFFAQSTNEARVKQVFPFVKVVSFHRCSLC
jgi:hypothetical protein